MDASDEIFFRNNALLLRNCAPFNVLELVRRTWPVVARPEHDAWVAATQETKRGALVDALVTFAKANAFDGLDLDWEPIETQDQAPLLALAQALRAQRPNLLLTMPVGWINSNFPPNNEAAFMDAIGYVFLWERLK